MVGMMAFASFLVLPACIIFFGWLLTKDHFYFKELNKWSEKEERGEITIGEYYDKKRELDRKYNR